MHLKVRLFPYETSSSFFIRVIISQKIAQENGRNRARLSLWIKRNGEAAHTQCEYPCNLQWTAYPFASARGDRALSLSAAPAASAFRSYVRLLLLLRLFFFLVRLLVPHFFNSSSPLREHDSVHRINRSLIDEKAEISALRCLAGLLLNAAVRRDIDRIAVFQ